jgi:hypothetical protein
VKYKLKLKKQLSIENITRRTECAVCEVQNEDEERVERRSYNDIQHNELADL